MENLVGPIFVDPLKLSLRLDEKAEGLRSNPISVCVCVRESERERVRHARLFPQERRLPMVSRWSGFFSWTRHGFTHFLLSHNPTGSTGKGDRRTTSTTTTRCRHPALDDCWLKQSAQKWAVATHGCWQVSEQNKKRIKANKGASVCCSAVSITNAAHTTATQQQNA